jgi:hypothetical protein
MANILTADYAACRAETKVKAELTLPIFRRTLALF